MKTTTKRTATHLNIGTRVCVTEPRQQEDFYATDPATLTALMNSVVPKGKIYECCCGQGHLANRLEEMGYNVVATDLIDRGCGIGGVDFMKLNKLPSGVHTICTNPPYGISTDFICHALDIMQDGDEMYLFLKTLYTEGKERYTRIFTPNPPYKIIQFVSRQSCAKDGNFDSYNAKLTAYAWFCWRKGYKGNTVFEWAA